MIKYESKCNKSTCEKYTIRWNNYEWAIFTIDENGLFNCQSSYGNYQYRWPNHGRKSFKHFILDLAKDPLYLLNKVSKKTRCCYEESLKLWKQEIIQMRRDKDCTKKQARMAWNFFLGLDEYSNSEILIQKEIFDSPEINDIYPNDSLGALETFEAIMDYPRDAWFFAKKIMPMFAEVIKKEIASLGE